MAKGMALTIGLNQIDEGHYQTTGDLSGCEPDARSVSELLSGLGYEVQMLLTRDATRANVQQGILKAAESLEAGDIFVIHYSGHGSEIPDSNDPSGKDQTWCLFDAEMLDKELRKLWTHFKANVRVIILSDSCHSGTVLKALEDETVEEGMEGLTPRALSPQQARAVYDKHKRVYDTLKETVNRNLPADDELVATIVLISACLDDQTAKDDGEHGVFTRSLLSCANSGKFSQEDYTYMTLADDLKAMVSQFNQSPRMTTLALAKVPLGFSVQKPFAIEEA